MASEAVITRESIEKTEASSDAEHYRSTAAEERRLVRKIDGRILPIACVLYLFACSFRSFSPLALSLT
jgi:hypothetical protein